MFKKMPQSFPLLTPLATFNQGLAFKIIFKSFLLNDILVLLFYLITSMAKALDFSFFGSI